MSGPEAVGLKVTSLFNNRDYSDIAIYGNDTNQGIYAHLAILSRYSDYFAQAVSENPNITNLLLDATYLAVYCALQYFYAGTYSPLTPFAILSQVNLHLEIHLLGETFMVNELQAHATEQIRKVLTRELHGVESALFWHTTLPQIVAAIYEATESEAERHLEIRAIVVDAVVWGLEGMGWVIDAFKEVREGWPEFVDALVERQFGSAQKERENRMVSQ